MDRYNIFSTIREIPNMENYTYAHVFQDTNSVCLGIYIYDRDYNNDHPEAGFWFNIDWLDDEEKVNWLAHVISREIARAYSTGKRNKRTEVQNIYKNFMDVIKTKPE